MSRDELAARVVVSLAPHLDHGPRNYADGSFREWPDTLVVAAFGVADAFETERKRRLTEPEGVK